MNQEIIQLFHKYLNRTSSSEEMERVLQLIESGKYEREWDMVLSQDALMLEKMENDLDSLDDPKAAFIYNKILRSVLNKEESNQPLKRRAALWPRLVAAASILLVSGLAFYFFKVQHTRDKDQQVSGLENDIGPGGNKAYLTLANGKKLSLTDAMNGTLAKEAGVEISKTADGHLIYEVSSSNHPASLAPSGSGGEAGEGGDHSNNSSLPSGLSPQRGERGMALNTIETPKGGQYQVRLPDGTKVWLNAASSLKYPVSFNGSEKRAVELTGEAYFEVAKNKSQPFIVRTANQEVKVLGTHFNINAYPDEGKTKTTLLEGLVVLDNSIRLQPGEQAVSSHGHTRVAQVDTDEAVAWKNGYFIFADEDIYSVMRKISRWYDVEVTYEGRITTNNFNGVVSRFSKVSDLLHILKSTKTVHFKIEGRRITVMP